MGNLRREDLYCSWLYTRIAGPCGFSNQNRVWALYLTLSLLLSGQGRGLKDRSYNFVLYYNQYISEVIEISSGREFLLLY